MKDTILARPGSPGAFGALMDEYARAGEDFLAVVERHDDAAYAAARESADPDCRSVRVVCQHVVNAAVWYARDLRRGLELDPLADGRGERPPRADVPTPRSVRAPLVEAIRWTETSGERLREREDGPDWAREFRVSWGSAYNAESILEHAIVHLLRHRRQLERWRALGRCAEL